jgi:hypothetical protein
MIPHATALPPQSLRVAMVPSSFHGLSMVPVRGPRGLAPTGGLTRLSAVDMSPIAVPVDDELVTAHLAREHQSLQPNPRWSDKTGPSIQPDSHLAHLKGPPLAHIRRGLGGCRALSYSTSKASLSYTCYRHFLTLLHAQAATPQPLAAEQRPFAQAPREKTIDGGRLNSAGRRETVAGHTGRSHSMRRGSAAVPEGYPSLPDPDPADRGETGPQMSWW